MEAHDTQYSNHKSNILLKHYTLATLNTGMNTLMRSSPQYLVLLLCVLRIRNNLYTVHIDHISKYIYVLDQDNLKARLEESIWKTLKK